MIPSTLKECFEALDIILPEDIKKEIINSESDKFMGSFHHGLGRWMRNNWGLWQENSNLFRMFKEKEIWHPDDMSAIILVSYWRVKHDKPIDLERQIKYYKDFWEKEKQELSEQKR